VGAASVARTKRCVFCKIVASGILPDVEPAVPAGGKSFLTLSPDSPENRNWLIFGTARAAGSRALRQAGCL